MGILANASWDTFKNNILNALFRNEYGAFEGSNTFQQWDSPWVSTIKQEQLNQQTIDNIKAISELISKYNLSESEINSILNSYKWDSIFSAQNVPQQMLADLQEMDKWNDYIGDAPELPDPDKYYKEAEDAINRENAELEAMYTNMFGNTEGMLKRELAENQAAFSDYRNQMLTNEAMGQQAVAGSTRYELDRQQRNAISRGASAAQRLVTNINTQLGLQAQSAQQSLNTSNALAQQLLAQRQAQAGIRQDYMNAQNQYMGNLADLRRGNAERISNYQNMKLNQAKTAYDMDYQRYNDRMNNIQGTNPWSSAYTAYRTKQKYNQGGL